ncbi:MAG: hypothetical protein Q8M92_03515, partial [Candidatus Subteraquimicrobiales bacterium]|nr:hypothetical protein [Candidatus Subteraquimicrobiales bacterium]
MKIPLKLFIIFLVMIVVIFLVGSCIIQVLKPKPAVLIDFSPTVFSIKVPTPIYFYQGNKLYYSEDGVLYSKNSKEIYEGAIRDGFVSPNFKYIVIDTSANLWPVEKKEAYLISNSGKKIKIADDIIPWKGFHCKNEMIQWSPSSQKILFMRNRLPLAKNASWYLLSQGTELFIFDVEEGYAKEILSPFSSGELFWSKDEKSIYYMIYTAEGNEKS